MFTNCNLLTSIVFLSGNFKVTNVENMFENCSSLKSLDLSRLNSDKVPDMNHMFSSCYELESLTFNSNFDTSKVTNMEYMFYNCHNLKTIGAYIHQL